MVALNLSLAFDSAALFMPTKIIRTPQQIFGSALKHGYQGSNPSNVQATGVWTSWADLGQSPVTLNGAGVTGKPAVVSPGINGELSAGFDSANQQFFQSASSLALAQPFTIGMIIDPTAVTPTNNSRFWVVQDGSGGISIQYNDTTPSIIISAGGTPIVCTDALGPGQVMAIIAYFNGNQSFVTVNHGAKFGVGTDIGAFGLTTLDMGLSPGVNPDFDANGDISEFWTPAGTLSDSDLADFQAYLCNAAGV